MEYITDREHLQWKIKQVERVIEEKIPKYRQMLALTKRSSVGVGCAKS